MSSSQPAGAAWRGLDGGSSSQDGAFKIPLPKCPSQSRKGPNPPQSRNPGFRSSSSQDALGGGKAEAPVRTMHSFFPVRQEGEKKSPKLSAADSGEDLPLPELSLDAEARCARPGASAARQARANHLQVLTRLRCRRRLCARSKTRSFGAIFGGASGAATACSSLSAPRTSTNAFSTPMDELDPSPGSYLSQFTQSQTSLAGTPACTPDESRLLPMQMPGALPTFEAREPAAPHVSHVVARARKR